MLRILKMRLFNCFLTKEASKVVGESAFKTRLFLLKIQKVTNLNSLIYFLKKIPFIGKKIPDRLYKLYSIKAILFYVQLVISSCLKVLLKFVWFGACFGIVSLVPISHILSLQGEKANWYAAVICWFLLVVLIKGGTSGLFYRVSFRDKNMHQLYNFPKKDLVLSTVVSNILGNCFSYLPAFIVGGLFLGHVVALPIFLFFGYVFFHLIGYLGNYLFCKYQVKTTLKMVIAFVLELIFLVLILLIATKGQFLLNNSFVLLLSALVLLVGTAISSFFWLKSLANERYIFELYRVNPLEVEQVEQSAKQSSVLEGVNLLKSLTVEEEHLHEKATGSAYLNLLLFTRYRKQLSKLLRFRLLLIVGTGSAIILASFFINAFKIKHLSELYSIFPAVIFLMYLLSFGKKIVQICFVNCDVAMLYYPFYRKEKVILSGYKFRLKETLKYNTIMTTALFLMFVLFTIAHSQLFEWSFFCILALLLVSLSLLLSFHELFIYYLLQPFTSDMEQKNPLYSLASGTFYFIIYLNIRLHITGWLYPVVFSLFALFYVLVGLVLIRKFAPKTFKIK